MEEVLGAVRKPVELAFDFVGTINRKLRSDTDDRDEWPEPTGSACGESSRRRGFPDSSSTPERRRSRGCPGSG